MLARHVLTILAARNLYALSRFYAESFSWLATIETRRYVEFALPGQQRLGLYERERFGRDFGGEAPGDVADGALRPFELYLQVPDLAIAAERVLAAGGRLLSAAAMREWGDEVAYFADPDGNVVALAVLKGVQKPFGNYTRDEFVRRVSDVLVRSGVADAQALVRDLENSVHFPMLARCGLESQMYRSRCVLLPDHEGYHEDASGAKWTRL